MTNTIFLKKDSSTCVVEAADCTTVELRFDVEPAFLFLFSHLYFLQKKLHVKYIEPKSLAMQICITFVSLKIHEWYLHQKNQ